MTLAELFPHLSRRSTQQRPCDRLFRSETDINARIIQYRDIIDGAHRQQLADIKRFDADYDRGTSNVTGRTWAMQDGYTAREAA